MKKEIFAIALLIIILAFSLVNTYYLKALTTEISELIALSQDSAELENWESSEVLAQKAIEIWRSNDHYTHIVLRHSDIDSMTNDFYELLGFIYSQDRGGVMGAAGLVNEHLKSISDMERLRAGSIF